MGQHTTHVRGRGGRVALAALAMAAGAAVAPATGAGAVAGVQDDQLAVVPQDQLQERLQLVRQSGAKAVRVDVLWSAVAPDRPANPASPNDPAYDWDRYDVVFRGLAARRVTPIVDVYSSPAWAAGGRSSTTVGDVNPNAPDAQQYGLFMRALATRYRAQVKHYEIWNEPNLPRFFRPRGGSAMRAYMGLVRAAYPQIKRGNPGATVIAGVLGPAGSARAWLRGLTRARGLRFDAFSQHIYPIAPPNRETNKYPTWAALPEMLRAIDTLPANRGKPLYVTEAGYTTASTIFRRFRVSDTKQRQYLRQIYALPAVRDPRVPVVVWFNLQDNRFWPGGLIREDGTRKPSYAAFRGFSGRPLTAVQRRLLR